ncbi:ADA regulatory protein [Salmonella bongori]|nr:ADA regulatory protein [Salmonella bongori]
MRFPVVKTVSYQQLAGTIGKPTAVRAVASACGANKLAIVIPCHRVVRRDGSLSGYRWGGKSKSAVIKAGIAKRGVAMLDLFADEEPWQESLRPARWCCAVLLFARRSRC